MTADNEKARKIQLDVFKKEIRYYVIKRKHIKNGYDEARVKNMLDSLDLPDIECVVIEHDWPMYHDVWDMIKCYVETGEYQSQSSEIERLTKELDRFKDCVPVPVDNKIDFDAYYLQDKRSYVGNDMVWWNSAGGYTNRIINAEVFTKEEAFKQHKSRSTDVPWLKYYIDKQISHAVDAQHVSKADEAKFLTANEVRK